MLIPDEDWFLFMKAAKNFMKNNFYQFICLLSGAVSAFHYEKVLSVIGKYQCSRNVPHILEINFFEQFFNVLKKEIIPLT